MLILFSLKKKMLFVTFILFFFLIFLNTSPWQNNERYLIFSLHLSCHTLSFAPFIVILLQETFICIQLVGSLSHDRRSIPLASMAAPAMHHYSEHSFLSSNIYQYCHLWNCRPWIQFSSIMPSWAVISEIITTYSLSFISKALHLYLGHFFGCILQLFQTFVYIF